MDDEETSGGGGEEPLVSREPSTEDLVDLCRELNREGANYLVVGGFAIRSAGYFRSTMDVDLVVDVSPENEVKLFKALESLPDQAVKELDPGDINRFTVCRVSDEILVNLMKTACGIDYEEASKEMVIREIGGVAIPFASPSLADESKNTSREGQRRLGFPSRLFQGKRRRTTRSLTRFGILNRSTIPQPRCA